MRWGFEWDPFKALGNVRKHRVTFEEAATVFDDLHSLTIPDVDHSDEECRELTLGFSNRGRILVVSFTARGDRLRIISARTATPQERQQYAQD